MRVGVYHPLTGVTLLAMPIVLFGMRVLEVLFFVGIIGSSVVVVIATWEDMRELFHKDEESDIQKTPAA